MNFNEQFNDLRALQSALDMRILENKSYPYDNMRVALFVELGEMLNELPTCFKHWKKTSVDNREKALEEYVDCLHFAISLLNFKNNRIFFTYEQCIPNNSLYDELIITVKSPGSASSLLSLFKIGNYFGFTWNEVYESYLRKNGINHERQEGGY